MNDRFTSMQLFVRVARSGGFSVAAREMRMTQPTASRIVAALEKQVGVTLLLRSTRTVTLTEAGTDYLARCETILAALDEADPAPRSPGELSGTLRIATSPVFASRPVMPRIAKFADQHPKLRMEFTLDDARHDLIGDSVDVAVRPVRAHQPNTYRVTGKQNFRGLVVPSQRQGDDHPRSRALHHQRHRGGGC